MKNKKQQWLAGLLFVAALLSILLTVGSSNSWAIVVTSTADSGPGTLREAIFAANADGVPTPITFDPSICPATITLSSALPALTDPGDTSDGSACGVILDGLSLVSGTGLLVRASNITIGGITVQDFLDDGIRVEPAGAGTTVTGVVISGNIVQIINPSTGTGDGISVSGGLGPGSTVGVTITDNNVINSNDRGIHVFGSVNGGGGNSVEVTISNNLIQFSRGEGNPRGAGDGMRIIGGLGNGSNNAVTSTITNNTVDNSFDDGIRVVGAGRGPASNNTLFTEIANNIVTNSGHPLSTRAIGIGVRGGSTGEATKGGSANTVTFVIAGNQVMNSKDNGIDVNGGKGSTNSLKGSVSNNIVITTGVNTIRTDANGIFLRGGPGTGNTLEDISVLKNSVSGSVIADGIQISGGSGGGATIRKILVEGNTSLQNAGRGIAAVRGSGAGNTVSVSGITDNQSNENGLHGIFVGSGVSGSGTTPVSGNQANNNLEDGIHLNATGYVVMANEANNNAVNGIYAVGNVDGGGNTASGNASCNTPGCF